MSDRIIKQVAFPKWLRELDRFVPLKSEIFLYGNLYDRYQFPINYSRATNKDGLDYTMLPSVREVVGEYLLQEGFELIVLYDVLDGFLVISPSDRTIEADTLVPFLIEADPTSRGQTASQILGDRRRLSQLSTPTDALRVLRVLVRNSKKLAAGIVTQGSRLARNPNALDTAESECFMTLLKAAQEARVWNERNLRNVLLLTCDKLNDIPSWLLLENPLTKGIEIARPNRDERLRFFHAERAKFHLGAADSSQPRARDAPDPLEGSFADLTDGFTNHELENLKTISKREQIALDEIKAIVDLYKYGERENFWETLDAAKIDQAESELARRVLGQPAAIAMAVAILRRAKLGLNTVDAPGSNRPKGVLFLAGPTGTGKTELAKGLAQLVFQDEAAIVRFDMSEYSDSNSDVKLIGAPPGYVGYEEGGQLTRRMRSKPFSIVLFDEIEKAHPKVFDKFLQILDDGRLTDGKGETVYFGECIILFTSNLGVNRSELGERHDNIDFAENSYEGNAQRIKDAIGEFFSVKLNRPEILNRFGDNFVVFDFIRPEISRQILVKLLRTIQQNLLREKNWQLTFEDAFVSWFQDTHLADTNKFGGRGIKNRVETHIKNGLANFVFSTEGAQERLEQGGIVELKPCVGGASTGVTFVLR